MTESTRAKIVDLDELAGRIARARADGQVVTLCHGVFDLLHIGHMRYFERARELGDLLVVTVTPDLYVDKGAFRPAFPDELRLEAIAALSVVDLVALNAWPTAEQTLRRLRPDIYAKGAEFRQVGADATGKMEAERAVAEEIGCRLAFVDDLVFSSSQLINLHLRSYPEEVAGYLAPLRERWSAEDAAGLLARFAELSVLVAGETLEETTHRVESRGLSGRDGSPVMRSCGESSHLAGAPTVARCLAALGGSVKLLTCGPPDSLESALTSAKTRAEIPVEIHSRPSEPGGAFRHRRFVDDADGRVWLTLHDDGKSSGENTRWIKDRLAELAPAADVLVWADQGRGLIEPDALAGAGNVHVAHLVTDLANGPALPNVDLTLWLYGDRDKLPAAAAHTLGLLEPGGGALLRRADRSTEAPGFADRAHRELGAEAFAAAFCLADAAGAEPELTLLTAQAARLLAAAGDPAPSRRRLLKQLTSMLK